MASIHRRGSQNWYWQIHWNQVCQKGEEILFKSMIYHEGFHFVSVGKNNTVWFHDRQVGRNCIYEKMLEKFNSPNLQSCDGCTVSLVIYIHKNKPNWTHNCHAPAMALSSKSLCCASALLPGLSRTGLRDFLDNEVDTICHMIHQHGQTWPVWSSQTCIC
jgi:hypothetical protein